MKCKNCQTEIVKGGGFCPSCGSPVPKKIGGVVIAVLVATAAAVTGAYFIMKPPSLEDMDRTAFYVKDEVLYAKDLGRLKEEPVVVGDEFQAFSESYDEYEDTGVNPVLLDSSLIRKQKDGIYYPTKVEYDVYIGTTAFISLYWKGRGEETEKKLDTNIYSYYVVGPQKILYWKENGSLYLNENGKKKRISEDVYDLYENQDNSAFVWTETDWESEDNSSKIYYQNFLTSEQIVLLADEAKLLDVSEDLSRVYYLDGDGTICLIENQGEKQELQKDVSDVYCINSESGKFYFTKNKDEKVYTGMDFVEDDMAGSETQEVSQEKTSEDLESQDYDFEYEYEQYDETDEERRARLIEELSAMDLDYSIKELYYFENGQIQLIDDQYNGDDIWGYENGHGDNICLFYYNRPEMYTKKWKLSTLTDASDVWYGVDYGVDYGYEEEEKKSHQGYLVVGGKRLELEGEVASWRHDKKAQKVYFLEKEPVDVSDEYSYDQSDSDWIIKSVSYGQDGDLKAETVDDGVSNILYTSDGHVYYQKEALDSSWDSYSYDEFGRKGDLYDNGKLVASDVLEYRVMLVPNGEGLVLVGEVDDEKNQGKLMYWNGESVTEIAEDVYDFNVVSPKDILMITDYDTDKEKGQLKFYDGNSVVDVDSDVSLLFEREMPEDK